MSRFITFCESYKRFQLDGLNLTSHLSAKIIILLMSFCKIVPAALGIPTTIERQVSSANELIFDWISSTTSFM